MCPMKWLAGGMCSLDCLTIMNEDFLVTCVRAVICVLRCASVTSVRIATINLCSFDNHM